jgi:hypothetical protein
MNRILRTVKLWVPLAVVITAMSGLVYLVAQQMLRMGANDPQIYMAEDAAAALNKGGSSEAVVPKQQVEISTSLAPFLVLYDASGKPVSGSGMLDGNLPDYPIGALEAAKHSGENRVTWQPRDGVRIASVAVPSKDGYVVAGRSLREVENRVSQIGTLVALAWLVTLAAAFVAVAFGEFALRARERAIGN